MCCASYDKYFNNKLVCVVYPTIYSSVTKEFIAYLAVYIVQQQNCVCCASYNIYFNNKIVCVVYPVKYGSVTKLCMLCILQYYTVQLQNCVWCTSYNI